MESFLTGIPDIEKYPLHYIFEDLKHQQLFLRFGDLFNRGFGTKCDLLDGASDVAQFVLSKSPMGVLLVTLHLELITQAHYVESMQDSRDMEPLFQRMSEPLPEAQETPSRPELEQL